MSIVRKIKLIVLCAALLFVVTACGSKSDRVVAKVEGENIYRWEVDALFLGQKDALENMSGVNFDDPNNYLDKRKALTSCMEQVISNKIMYLLAIQDGHALLPEELQRAEQQRDEMRVRSVQLYMETLFKGQPDAQEQAEKNYDLHLSTNSLTPERVLQSIQQEMVINKYVDAKLAEQGLLATDEVLQGMYDSLVKQQKEEYEKSPEQYAKDILQTNTQAVVYAPYEAKRVRSLQVAFPEAVNEEITAKYAENEAAGKDFTKNPGEMFAEMERINTEISILRKRGLEQSRTNAENMLRQIKEGADFLEIMDNYGTDPQMKTYAGRLYGYIVYEDAEMAESYIKAAMELAQPGDVSELISTEGGWCILQLMETLPQGTKPFEEAKGWLEFQANGYARANYVTQVGEADKKNWKITRYLEALR